MNPRRLPRARRHLVTAAITAVVVFAAGMTTWRVFRPAEVLITARSPSYPEPSTLVPGRVGALMSAPLIIDDRLRVYARKREVWADGPPLFHYEHSAYWSFRRWPAELTGVIVVTAARPVVVTAWSDGVIVAIDAVTGQMAWRARSEPLHAGYTGRRTGAETVYQPPGLFITDSAVIAAAAKSLSAFSFDGKALWTRPLPVAEQCRGIDFTTGAEWLVHDTCQETVKRVNASSGADLATWLPGTTGIEPISCSVGHSACLALRVTGSVRQGWLINGPEPRPAPPLATAGAVVAGDLILVPRSGRPGTEVLGYHLTAGNMVWRWASPAPAQLLAGDGHRVFLLTSERTLITLDPRNGLELGRSDVEHPRDPAQPYLVSRVYTSRRYVVIERVNPQATANSPDALYYYTLRPVLLAVG